MSSIVNWKQMKGESNETNFIDGVQIKQTTKNIKFNAGGSNPAGIF